MAYTTIDDPLQYFNTVLFTGNGSTQSITGVGFQPDWVWIKNRGAVTNHEVADSVRGANKLLKPNDSDAEQNNSNKITSFDSDGFGVGNDANVNQNSNAIVSWNWKAGTSVSGTTGGSGTSKSYSGSVNTDAGISIIAYTGNSTGGHTVPHHLGVAPQLVLCKRRGQSGQWTMGHDGLGGFDKFLELDLTSAQQSQTKRFDDTAPSSTVFTLGSGLDTNANNITLIAYCFAEKQGYSKFGSYEGNGSSDGTFIYTGFKPAWVVTKSIDSTSHWNCKDNKRSTFNPVDDYHKLNEPTAEDTGVSNHAMDFLSNGFKHRGDNDEVNGSETYIYMAFAESPFVNSNGVPANAR